MENFILHDRKSETLHIFCLVFYWSLWVSTCNEEIKNWSETISGYHNDVERGTVRCLGSTEPTKTRTEVLVYELNIPGNILEDGETVGASQYP